MKITRWGGAGAVLGLAVGGLALAAPAHAQDDCRTVVSTLVDRPDSAVGGGTWALDQLERTVEVCQVSDGRYQATVTDLGTFETVELDHTPAGTDQPLPAGITGTVEGGFTTIEFEAARLWESFNASVLDGVTVTGADRPSSTWVSELFSDVDKATLDGENWSWTYTTCSEEWVNQADALGGNKGDITGKECPSEPTPTPTTKPSPEPECVDVNTANAETLTLLRHVDAERAQQILDLRPFTSVDDLDRVDGLAAGGPRLAELVAGGNGFLPLCEITAGEGGEDDDEGLPVTGLSTGMLAAGGALLLAIGGGAYLLARRRRMSFTA